MTSLKEGGTTTKNVFAGNDSSAKIKSLVEENNSLIAKVKELEAAALEKEKKREKDMQVAEPEEEMIPPATNHRQGIKKKLVKRPNIPVKGPSQGDIDKGAF